MSVQHLRSHHGDAGSSAARASENWWTRNFFWCAPALALLVVVMLVFLCMGAFTMMTGLGELRPLRDMAFDRVVDHTAVQQRMPGEIEMARGFQAPVRGEDLDYLPMRIPIRTDDRTAEIRVVGERDANDQWGMVYLAVEFTGDGRLWIIEPDDPDWKPFDDTGTPGRPAVGQPSGRQPNEHQPSNGG